VTAAEKERKRAAQLLAQLESLELQLALLEWIERAMARLSRSKKRCSDDQALHDTPRARRRKPTGLEGSEGAEWPPLKSARKIK
jgi:hypothetical protein